MRVAHLLRKYNPAEWGGTETAVERLFEGLRPEVTPVIYCPRADCNRARDPLAESGYEIKRFRACVPIWGLPKHQRAQMISVGGNILSFDLVRSLWREQDLSVIHSHALGRLGGIGLTIAKRRNLPFVVTIHGGFLDLPESLRRRFHEPTYSGIEWGKLFGAVFNSRQVIPQADAILTCNEREAALLREQFPTRRIHVQSHGVPIDTFSVDHRRAAEISFHQIVGRRMVLVVGRIDPVKNQGWLIEQAPAILARHPKTVFVLAGACTDAEYGAAIERRIQELGLQNKVLLIGGLSPGDPKLIGLMQAAAVMVLPSIAETFGLVILEAWAAGTPVISSRTSGASSLIQHGDSGWLFDLENPQEFHHLLDKVLSDHKWAGSTAKRGRELARAKYDTRILAGQVRDLYRELVEEKNALRNHSRR